MIMSNDPVVNIIIKSINVYYAKNVLSTYNKVHRMTILKKTAFFSIILFTSIILLYNISNNIPPNASTMHIENITWLIIIYILLRLLLPAISPITKSDICILQISDSSFNALLGYNFLSTYTIFFIPLLLSIYVTFSSSSFINGTLSFIFLYIFINLSNGMAFFLQLLKKNLKSQIIRIINIAIIMCITVLLWMHMSNIEPPHMISFITGPISSIINSILHRSSLIIDNPIHYILPIILYLLFFLIFFKWLSIRNYEILIKEEDLPISIQNNSLPTRRFTFIDHSVMIYKNIIGNKSSLFSMLTPCFIYIYLCIYIFHNAINNMEEISNTSLLMAQWLALIGFPVIYVAPNFRSDMRYLWFYRNNKRSTNIFYLNSIAKYYLVTLTSLAIASSIITLYIFCVYDMNFFDFLHIPTYFLVTFIMPIMFSMIGLLISLRLSSIFNHNNKPSIFTSIPLIWLVGLITLPCFIFLGTCNGYISITFLLTLSVSLFFLCKRAFYKVEI